jgi:hypothetical protein
MQVEEPYKIPEYHQTKYVTLGASVFDSLIGMHVFTCCDIVSAFAGYGKMTFKQMEEEQETPGYFKELVRPRMF